MKQTKINSAFEILPQMRKSIKKAHPVMKGYDISDEEIQKAWKEDKPITLSLYLGAKCNLKCRYCFTRGGELTENNLTEEEYKKVIDEAFELGVKYVMFTGRGEPLFYAPLLFRLLKYIKHKGGWSIVLTNGTLVTKKIARELYGLNCSVMTKINSFDPEVQDNLVGVPGIANKMYRGFYNLMQASFNKTQPTRFANDNIICKLNYGEIPFMTEYLLNCNIQPIYETILWKGRAIENADLLRINKGELTWLYDELKKSGEYYAKGTYFRGEECVVDTTMIIVNERGDVMPCWAREELFVGNIRKSSLKNLWFNEYLVKLRREHREIVSLVKKGLMSPRECPGRQYARKKYLLL